MKAFVPFALAGTLLLSAVAFASDSVPLAELPPLVAKSLREHFPGARLLSATKEERNDYVHYFVTVTDASGERRIELIETGAIVAPSLEKTAPK